jgi:predicted secreted protein
MTSMSTVTQFLVLSEVDVGRESQVQVDGLTVVALEENAGSTGYIWKYEPLVGAPERLKLLADSGLYGDRSQVGAPGAHVFLFDAVQAGTTQLQLGLYSSGEQEELGREVTFDIEIVPAD